MSGGDENAVGLDSTATLFNIDKPDAVIVYQTYNTADLKRECSLELRYSKATIHKLGF
jgi:hypothetical protein